MIRSNRVGMIAICVFVLLTVTCNIGPLTISLDKPFDSSQGKFGSIAFAEDVTDDGDPINPSTTFASDTEDVWALWTFTGIKSGTPWRREWKRDGKLITGVDETWEEDESGWIAYPLSDETGVEGGKYTFTLYIQGQRVQEASFTVGQRSPTTAQKMQRASFGSITLCEGATEDGKPIKPSNSFPAGATQVTALFMYTDLVPGQAWGRVWMKDGKEYISKRDEKWDRGDKGWRTLSLTDEDGIEGGHYILILYIGDRMLQQSAFDVAAAPRKPASFGPITFAKDMTKDRQPVDAGTVFQQGIKRVIALFPYADMKNDQAWSREWIQDGQVLSNTGWKWGEQIDGTTYLDITGPNSGALAPGKYTLNLYLDGKVARTATFTVVATPPTAQPPARPEEIIDAQLIPIWRKLASANHPTVRALAQMTLQYRIPVRLGYMSGNGAYQFSTTQCNTVPGKITISSASYSRDPWQFVAGTLAHELTHAYDALEIKYPCRCTIQDEYRAFAVKLWVMWDFGRTDLVDDYFRDVFDRNGYVNEGLLWRKIKSNPAYKDCPDR